MPVAAKIDLGSNCTIVQLGNFSLKKKRTFFFLKKKGEKRAIFFPLFSEKREKKVGKFSEKNLTKRMKKGALLNRSVQ